MPILYRLCHLLSPSAQWLRHTLKIPECEDTGILLDPLPTGQSFWHECKAVWAAPGYSSETVVILMIGPCVRYATILRSTAQRLTNYRGVMLGTAGLAVKVKRSQESPIRAPWFGLMAVDSCLVYANPPV